MYYRRLRGEPAPWTSDSILKTYRFTNTYRVADRVSQYLIREVQYHPSRPQTSQELFFRTLLFKVFNKIETWEALERAHGPLTWKGVDLNGINKTLSGLRARGHRIYSAAYIMPAPGFGAQWKHTNHLKLIGSMMTDRLSDRIRQAPDFASVYERVLQYPGLGRFLAYQYAIDLNYSELLDFSEDDFVVAGPGAIDGISKCFASTGALTPEEVIRWVSDRQEQELSARGIGFSGLFGRRLHLIDCQNLFCEISKYARVAHPNISGAANRQKIKQSYKQDHKPLPEPMLPPRWRVHIPRAADHRIPQLALL